MCSDFILHSLYLQQNYDYEKVMTGKKVLWRRNFDTCKFLIKRANFRILCVGYKRKIQVL